MTKIAVYYPVGGAKPTVISKIQAAMEAMGIEFKSNPYGAASHAEIYLYENVSGVKTIGISNTGGPCLNICTPYFTRLIGKVEIVYP